MFLSAEADGVRTYVNG